jgi:hypothetical protein
MKKKITLIFAFLLIPAVGNTTQEYISADSNDTQNTNNSLPAQPATSIAPQSDQIYVLHPAQQQANNGQPAVANSAADVSEPTYSPSYLPANPQARIANPPANDDSTQASAQPQAPANNNVNSMNNVHQNSLGQNNLNQTSSPTLSQPGVSNEYTDQEKQGWLTSCTSAITNHRVSAYAQEFCGCGWQHISSGELSPMLLTSLEPADAKKRNSILKAISQECLVQVMANHNLK